MRIVPSIPPAPTSPDTRHVTGLSAAQAVKPVQPRERPISYVEQQTLRQDVVHQDAVHPDSAHPVTQQQRNVPLEERRKARRRVNHLPVLIELRSGVDRRHNNLRGGGVVEHIDIEA